MSATSSCKEIVDQVLKLLDTVSSKLGGNSQIQNQVKVATRAVEQIQLELNQPNLKLLAELVQAANWAKATEVLTTNFPATSSIRPRVVTKVLALTFKGNNLTFLKNAFDWVIKNLESGLQPGACEELYQLIICKQQTKQPLVLLLLKIISECLISVQDHVRIELEANCRRLIDRIVEGIKKEDYFLCTQATKLDALEFYIPMLVAKFDVNSVDSVQLLISFSERMTQEDFKVSISIINSLVTALEKNALLMDSEQALDLLMHVKSVTDGLQGWTRPVDWEERLELCRVPLEKLEKRKQWFFLQFQRYVEDKDVKEFQLLLDWHDSSWNVRLLVTEFVSWYFNNGESMRTHRLLAVARKNVDKTYSKLILQQLESEMVRQEKIQTFDAFVLYSHQIKKSSSAPSCVRLLHSSFDDKHQLLLVNKYFKMPMCLQNERVLCFDSQLEDEMMWSSKVDLETALTTFTFDSGDTSLGLFDASAPGGMVRVAAKGAAQWKVKPVDENHVKIFNQLDLFVTAGNYPCQNDDDKRLVYMMIESDTDEQLWEIIKKTSTIDKKIPTRKRSHEEASCSNL